MNKYVLKDGVDLSTDEKKGVLFCRKTNNYVFINKNCADLLQNLKNISKYSSEQKAILDELYNGGFLTCQSSK